MLSIKNNYSDMYESLEDKVVQQEIFNQTYTQSSTTDDVLTTFQATEE